MQLAKLGNVQLIDIERSGTEIHDAYFRTCTVLQGVPARSAIGDDVPHRIAELYGGSWETWNRHFIAQVAGCPFGCWYCYVDNLRADRDFTVDELVQRYGKFKRKCPDINVFHLMGGCPGRYAQWWPLLRGELDREGHADTVLLTDAILVEDYLYKNCPWLYIPDRAIVSVCLKGTNHRNFRDNTGTNYYWAASVELYCYIPLKQAYFTLLQWDPMDENYMERLLGEDRINWLNVKEYEVVKRRKKGEHDETRPVERRGNLGN